jgi:hypothetical protein
VPVPGTRAPGGGGNAVAGAGAGVEEGTPGGAAEGVWAEALKVASKAAQRGAVPFMEQLGLSNFRGNKKPLFVHLHPEVKLLAAFNVGSVEG